MMPPKAWDKTLKQIIPVHNIDFQKRMINTDSAWRTFDEVELLWPTGLKDKHGQMIYERHIVQIKGHAFQRDKSGIGIDIDRNYVVKRTKKMELILVPVFDLDVGWILSENIHYVEIIGNIYEHPHLLGGEINE